MFLRSAMRFSTRIAVFCVSSQLMTLAFGAVNITIDDQLGDATNGNVFTYKPAGAWAPGVSCNCTANPDLSQVNDGTWTWTKFQPDNGSDDPFFGQIRSASIPFFGEFSYVRQEKATVTYEAERFGRLCQSRSLQLENRAQRKF